jgi:anti-anti-sigma regulatory factor
MLRITIHDKKHAVVLLLEGELIGPWVQEVEQCWRKVFASLGDRSVHVDLSAVSFVDAAGGALLHRMHEAGFRFAEGAEMGHAWDGEGFNSQADAN